MDGRGRCTPKLLCTLLAITARFNTPAPHPDRINSRFTRAEDQQSAGPGSHRTGSSAASPATYWPIGNPCSPSSPARSPSQTAALSLGQDSHVFSALGREMADILLSQPSSQELDPESPLLPHMSSHNTQGTQYLWLALQICYRGSCEGY